jgi:maltooligosyltrehalose trehalohydrolase
LIVNFGRDLKRSSFAEPLLAPPSGVKWQVAWSSESPRYGGHGVAPLWVKGHWRIPAESAVVLAPEPTQATDDMLGRGEDG